MTDNDLFYVCSLIEYVGRKTKNKRGAIVSALGEEGIAKQLHDASVNHSLPFELVASEIIRDYGIVDGDFDTISGLKYTLPGFQDIGKLYAILVEMMESGEKLSRKIHRLFSSFLSDEISHFETDLYYQNPSYLFWSFQAGNLL